jgi:23S rRNA pseudouridine1911/1915/1917 synthase
MHNSDWLEIAVSKSAAESKSRLDAWLAKELVTVSRSKVQEMIESGLVLVNRVRANSGKYIVKYDDVIQYRLLEKAKSNLEPVTMNLDILYEDDDLLVINKPAGIAVHPGAGDSEATLVHGLLAHAKTLGRSSPPNFEDDETAGDRPGIVHRLDKDTTGAIVVAKTDFAHAHLAKQFHDKTNFRQYVALLNGELPEGEWVRESWLYRDTKDRTRFASLSMDAYNERRDAEGHDIPGFRYARTLFKREKAFANITLSSIRLYTGRTHQIRVHAKDIHAPVWGDPTYGRLPDWNHKCPFDPSTAKLLLSVDRQLLHAWILGFAHPKTGEWLQFEASLPKDFSNLLEHLEKDSKLQTL